MKLRPLNDKIVIEPDDQGDTKTSSGIIIPEVAQEKPQMGTVVANGPGRLHEHNPFKDIRHSMTIEVGDRVLYSKFAGTEIDIDGVTHLVINEAEVLAVVE